jgi:methylglutaconyl-CoA hydratase
MNYDYLKAELADAVFTVTLSRPERHNAFDETLIAELTDAVSWANASPFVRVIVLRSEGASFCSGADLNWMRKVAAYTLEENEADARQMQLMYEAIADSPKATVARVQGAAIGGGAGLVAACDIAVASEDAKFAFSEVRLGIAPAVIAPYVLRKISAGAARDLFLTGERFSAAEAFRLGLVQKLVFASQLDEALTQKVNALLQGSPDAIERIKTLLEGIIDRPVSDVAPLTVRTIAEMRVSGQGQEGITAFLEKRKPSYVVE